MKRLWREVYGAGILFFYYMKWIILLGYLALIYGLEYPRHWSIDLLWIYSAALVVKDFVYKFILKKSYCDNH